jgi:hypothetical protein
LIALLLPGVAEAQQRFVERTPLPRHPAAHTTERAGYPTKVSRFAVPSVTAKDVGGSVGGGRLFGNRIFVKDAGAVTGSVFDGTYGTDYAGLHVRPGRVFLAPSYDPSVGPTVARSYRTDGHYPPDVIALRPFRKAVIEAKEHGHR